MPTRERSPAQPSTASSQALSLAARIFLPARAPQGPSRELRRYQPTGAGGEIGIGLRQGRLFGVKHWPTQSITCAFGSCLEKGGAVWRRFLTMDSFVQEKKLESKRSRFCGMASYQLRGSSLS